MDLSDYLTTERIRELALPSNFDYGEAIYRRGAVEMIEEAGTKVEAWVGGLDGTVREGGGSRRRTTLAMADGQLQWHCTGNPKTHQIFCKHCVALALRVGKH
ncbi:MAG TPA: hypothetical protein VLF67_01310 [Candidatus Saccharimonas sp.]|nr:hypothetical protein [Candidatus Saccharimonas sp.]